MYVRYKMKAGAGNKINVAQLKYVFGRNQMKTMREKEKMLIPSISPFPTLFSNLPLL